MKKANRLKVMYAFSFALITLVVIPASYNVISKQQVSQSQVETRKPFDKKCAKKKIEGFWQQYGHVPYHLVEQAMASCEVSWDEFYLLHDDEVRKNQ